MPEQNKIIIPTAGPLADFLENTTFVDAFDLLDSQVNWPEAAFDMVSPVVATSTAATVARPARRDRLSAWD